MCSSKTLCAIFLASLSISLSAEEFNLGLNAGGGASVYKGVGTEYYGFPLINYDNDIIYLDGTEVGYYFLKTPNHEFTVNLNYDGHQLDPSDSSDRRMKKLNNRRATMMGGLTYTYIDRWGAIQAQLLGDMLGNSKGVTADLQYMAQWSAGPITLAPTIGVTWYSSKYNDYYYGVSRSEARRSGFKQYKSDAGINPYLSLAVNYAVDNNWNVFVSGRYERLSSEVKDSPIVSKSGEASFQTGVSYKFK
jgi:outer membrane protein